MANYSILIVDDEPLIRQGLEVLIRNYHSNYSRIEQAANGITALEMMEQQHFDLVLTDIEMPEMDGLEFIKNCRERNYQSRFVILSGFNKFDYAQKACHFGVDDYLLKPVETKELYRVLERTEELLINDRSAQRLWNRFLSNPQEESLCQELERTYPHVRGWYYVLLQFDHPVSPFSLPTDFITLTEKEPSLMGVLIPENFDQIFSLNDTLMELNQTIKQKRWKALILAGQRVVRFKDVFKSKESAHKLLPQLFYRNWNSIVYAGEGCSFSKDESSLSMLLYNLKELCLQGGDTDNMVNGIYQDLLKTRLKPELCRLQFQQFLFTLFPYLEKWGIVKEEWIQRYNPLLSTDTAITLKDLIVQLEDFLCFFQEEQKQFRKCSSSGLIEEIILTIQKKYVLDIHLQEFAEQYRMNKAYLGQLFKKHTGQTFNQFLNSLRIEEACRLLKNTNQKVYEIAYTVGFRDPSYFVCRFEKNTGYSPMDYRRMNESVLNL